MAPHDSVKQEPPGKGTERKSGEDGWKIECKLSEFNNRAASRGQNDLIGEFKLAAGDLISIRYRL